MAGVRSKEEWKLYRLKMINRLATAQENAAKEKEHESEDVKEVFRKTPTFVLWSFSVLLLIPILIKVTLTMMLGIILGRLPFSVAVRAYIETMAMAWWHTKETIQIVRRQ